MKVSRGVYFLADDGVVELAIAFLNSFRKHNPSIALCLIPFSDNIARLKELQGAYGFSIFSNTKVYDWYDSINLKFHNKPLGHYRKLAIWEGEFDEFIYIDVDTVVLENIDFVFKMLSDYDFVASHSNMAHIVKWTWKESIYGAGLLANEQIDYAANTGFIASKKGAIALAEIRIKIAAIPGLKPHTLPLSYEQPFLNYLIVTSGGRYTSLFVLWKKGLYPGIALEQWAGTKGRKVRNGKIVLECHPVFLVHWAGKWTPTPFDNTLFSILKALGIKRPDDKPAIRFFMPYKRLWQYYRFMRRDVI